MPRTLPKSLPINLDDEPTARVFVTHDPASIARHYKVSLNVALDLRGYALARVDAHDARLAGNIQKAFAIEEKMERFYARLPAKARW